MTTDSRQGLYRKQGLTQTELAEKETGSYDYYALMVHREE